LLSKIEIVRYYLEQVYSLNRQLKRFNYFKNSINGKKELYNTDKLKYNLKGTKTIFILGSGKTINELNNNNLKRIEENDSIGFNNWIVHPFVPNIYLFDFKQTTEENKKLDEIFISNLIKRRMDYNNVNIILRLDNNLIKKHIERIKIKRLFFALQIGFAGRSVGDYKSSIKLLKKTRLLDNPYIFFNKNSTVHNTLLMAYKMGYNKIVLCGIDLDNHYFFEEYSSELINTKVKLPFNIQEKEIHKTNDPLRCAGGVPISKLIKVINLNLFKPNNIQLFVSSKNSKLYPQLPVYNWGL